MTNAILAISGISIKQDLHGRFCLNDLHKAAGGEKRHEPSRWAILQQTIELIEEMKSTPRIQGVEQNQQVAHEPFVVINGGANRGSYGDKELIYAYATWISAKFFLTVIRAYDAMVNQKPYGLKETAPTYLTPEMARHVQERINEICTIQGKHYNTYYGKLKTVFKANSYTLIPISKYADVCQWLDCKPICKMPEYIMVEASEIGELRLRRPYYEDDVLVSKSHLSVLKQFAFGLLPYNSVVIDGGRYDELVQAEQKLKSAEEALRDKPLTYREWVDVMDKMDAGDMVLLKKIV